MIRECIHCKKSRGGGSDVWCSEGHPYESYMRETECPYFEPYDDDYDDTYDDVYDNPNPSKKSEEYDIEIDSQNKFTIDFPVRHSHPLEINVFLLHFTYN